MREVVLFIVNNPSINFNHITVGVWSILLLLIMLTAKTNHVYIFVVPWFLMTVVAILWELLWIFAILIAIIFSIPII